MEYERFLFLNFFNFLVFWNLKVLISRAFAFDFNFCSDFNSFKWKRSPIVWMLLWILRALCFLDADELMRLPVKQFECWNYGWNNIECNFVWCNLFLMASNLRIMYLEVENVSRKFWYLTLGFRIWKNHIKAGNLIFAQ